MQLPTFGREQYLVERGQIPIGVDEAGRGPLAGPVVAAAVLWKPTSFDIPTARQKEFTLIRDSKKLSEKQREKAFILVQEFFHVGIGIIGPETIDRVNILEATFLAMKAALGELERAAELKGKIDQIVALIDGNQKISNLSLEQEAIVDGDALVKSIAAASIIAKVTRDRLIIAVDKKYPQYGFAHHKGYGTKEHMDALRRYGPSPIHRMSFRPVQLAHPENVNRKYSHDLLKRRPTLAKKRFI